MSLQSQSFYEFGPFRLEPSEHLLLRSGESIPLPPKALDTLLLLVQNSGHVLSKDLLMKTLWPDTFVEENNLTQHISMLRRALGEGEGESGYIETVPRLGYRFVVPVREVSGNGDAELLLQRRTRTHIVLHEQEEVTETDIAEDPAVATATRPRHQSAAAARKWIVVGLVAGAVGLATAAFVMLRSGRISFRPNPPRTLAVLPFRDLKPDAESQFLSYSLADAIINRLGYFNEISVRPSSYVAKYSNRDADPRVVAQDLHAQAVLTGNYIKEGDRLRVSAELVDVSRAEVLWHDTIDIPYDQLLTVQDQVAENVLRGLRLRILPQEAQRLKKSVPRNPIAYEYFLRAQNPGLPSDYHLAIQLLEKSLALDPDYAPAWARLALEYGGYSVWQGGGPEYMAKSKAAFDKALELDPDVPLVRTFMAIQMIERGELDQGVLNLREELRLNPNEVQAHWWLTEAYLYGGMLPESIAEGERALQLDPLANAGSSLNSYLYTGAYEKFLSRLPVGESARTTFYRGLCFLYRQDLPRAASEFERSYTLDPSLLHAKYGKAFLYAIHQEPAEGLQYLKVVELETPTLDGEMLYKLAQAHALLGDKPSALRLLREAIDHNFYCHACLIRDPLFESVRGEPEYADLVKLALDHHEDFRRKYF